MEIKKLINKNQYFCDYCDFKTGNKNDYMRHTMTSKHQNRVNGYAKNAKNANEILCYQCKCGKIYKNNSGLWKHSKVCKFVDVPHTEEMSKNDIIKQLLLQNQQLIFENKEFKEMMFEQSNKMLELVSKPTIANINNTNCNNNNNQFNLNVFLNEKCKNAMNMSDFIDSIQIHDDDFENIGKLGYIQGISNIFIKGLKDLDETVRPMHCNDIKRETLYIKDNDVWDKDESKKQVKHAIAMIAHKNFKYIPVWREANPSASDVTTKKNDLYMKIANQVTTAITPDDDSGINKIIRNVASNVVIDKK